MKQYTPAAPSKRALTQRQIAVMGLLPIFQACKAKGLPTDETSKARRLFAVNRYLCNFNCFDWIETSFKELLPSPAAITILADAIEGNLLTW